MTPEERQLAAQKIHEVAREMRGRFLNYVAMIEHEIGHILTNYFCTSNEDKKELFFDKIATSLSLQKKGAILFDIIEKDHPNYWNEYKEVFRKLEEIRTFRNQLAHSIIDVSPNALNRSLEDGIGFVGWKEGAPIKKQEFDEWGAKAIMVGSCLRDIKRLYFGI